MKNQTMKSPSYANVAVVFAALLVLALPGSGWAQFTYSFTNGAATITGYTGAGGNVTIPSTYEDIPVKSIGPWAFFQNSRLTSVTIPDSVTSIGSDAFDACSGLTNVMIGHGVTSIGDSAFWGSSLSSVTIPSSVTNVGAFAFQACYNLQNVYFLGNAPSVDGAAGSADTTVFQYDGAGTARYVPGTTGWGDSFGGWPTAAGNYQSRPQMIGAGFGSDPGIHRFQFNIHWAPNTMVVVEASINLQDWTPVSTNTLVNGTIVFEDLDWTNYPQRFYCLRPE